VPEDAFCLILLGSKSIKEQTQWSALYQAACHKKHGFGGVLVHVAGPIRRCGFGLWSRNFTNKQIFCALASGIQMRHPNFTDNPALLLWIRRKFLIRKSTKSGISLTHC
jgi:hypothetical protein